MFLTLKVNQCYVRGIVDKFKLEAMHFTNQVMGYQKSAIGKLCNPFPQIY